jgi:ketopantoate hydroxymethyltransferase
MNMIEFRTRKGPISVLDFRNMKDEGRKISMVTCYDYSSARAVAESEC